MSRRARRRAHRKMRDGKSRRTERWRRDWILASVPDPDGRGRPQIIQLKLRTAHTRVSRENPHPRACRPSRRGHDRSARRTGARSREGRDRAAVPGAGTPCAWRGIHPRGQRSARERRMATRRRARFRRTFNVGSPAGETKAERAQAPAGQVQQRRPLTQRKALLQFLYDFAPTELMRSFRVAASASPRGSSAADYAIFAFGRRVRRRFGGDCHEFRPLPGRHAGFSRWLAPARRRPRKPRHHSRCGSTRLRTAREPLEQDLNASDRYCAQPDNRLPIFFGGSQGGVTCNQSAGMHADFSGYQRRWKWRHRPQCMARQGQLHHHDFAEVTCSIPMVARRSCSAMARALRRRDRRVRNSRRLVSADQKPLTFTDTNGANGASEYSVIVTNSATRQTGRWTRASATNGVGTR